MIRPIIRRVAHVDLIGQRNKLVRSNVVQYTSSNDRFETVIKLGRFRNNYLKTGR